MKKSVLTCLILTALVLTGCSTNNQTYRGVSPQVWSQLTPEQRQLIVDQSYQRSVLNNKSQPKYD